MSNVFSYIINNIWDKVHTYLHRDEITRIEKAVRTSDVRSVIGILKSCSNEQLMMKALCMSLVTNDIVMANCIIQQFIEDASPILLKQKYCRSYDKEDNCEKMAGIFECKAICGRYGSTALMVASYIDDSRSVVGILKHNPDANVVDHIRRTPIFYACFHGKTECVHALLNKGAEVNIEDNNGISPLYVACKHGHVAVVSQLLEAGACIHGVTNKDLADVCLQSSTLNDKCKRCIDFSKYPLIVAIDKHYSDIVTLLVLRGINIHLRSEHDQTALHIACARGTLDIVKILCDNGADINAKDYFGQLPLFYCTREGDFSNGVGVFLRHRWSENNEIDLTCISNQEFVLKENHDDAQITSYLNSLDEGNKIISYLIQKGAIINCSDNNGKCLIEHALNSYRTHLTFILLKYGVAAPWRCCENLPGLFKSENNFVYNNLIRILVKHGLSRRIVKAYREKVKQLCGDVVSSKPIIILLSELEHPLSLKDQCRICIRNRLSTKPGLQFQKSVNSLDLPVTLKSFLMFEDLEQYMHTTNEFPVRLR